MTAIPQPGETPDPIRVSGGDLEHENAPVVAAYRRGRTHFMGIDLLIGPGVLVPRPETELVGRAVGRFLESLRATRTPDEPVRVIDMCCGSGNLTCGIAAACPSALVWASDLTDHCVELARRNVRELNLDDRVRVFQGDLFAPLAGEELQGQVDAIVCNPPYIPTKMLSDRTDLRHEPREAFDGGPYGLSILARVLREAPQYLRPGGRLFLELGPRDERSARELFERNRHYEDSELIRDESGGVWGGHARLRMD